MFTGLVSDIGAVARLESRDGGSVIAVRPVAIAVDDLAIGESIAHDGVCLTVTGIDADTFTVLAGAETLRRTTLGDLGVGSRVNLERALRVGDRLGGHMVSGHVDGVGQIAARKDLGANLVYVIGCDPSLGRYLVEKGSVAVDGVSLTVNRVAGDGSSFEFALIPHTVAATTLGGKEPGHKVNLEVDMIGKYVERLTAAYRPSAGGAP